MPQIPLTAKIAFAAGILAAGGCKQLYTGGFTPLAPEDREAVAAYQQFKTERDAKLRAIAEESSAGQEDGRGEAANAASGPRGSGSDQAVGLMGPRRAGGEPRGGFGFEGPTAAPTHNAAIARAAVGALGMYGQLGRANPAGNSSPMDHPGDLRRVTFTAEGADFDPAVDPAGQWVVYASTRHRETSDLYLKRVDGAAITQLTSDSANEIMPVFSPDGKKIAFCSDRAGNWDIYVMDVRGGKAVQITDDATQDIHPSFSPDGKRLVYCSHGSPSGQWEMMVVDLEAPGTKRLIGHGLFPTWSPTQEKIVFQRARQRGTRWFSVWVVELVDGEPMPPTEIAVSANAAVITPDWSPDGEHVVFCTVIDPDADVSSGTAQADLWMVKANGEGRVRLTSGPFANLQPAWSPDGSILFVSNRSVDGMENIWALRPRATEPVGPPAEVASHPGVEE